MPVARLSETQHDWLQIVIDHLPEGIFIKDTDGRFIVANAVHAKTLKAEHGKALIGKTDFDFLAEDIATQNRADDQTVLQSGQCVERQETIGNSIGATPHTFQTVKTPLCDSEGRIVGVLGITQDITQRKKDESTEMLVNTHKLVEAMLDNIPDRVYFKDAQSRFLKLSKALAKRLGIQNPKDAVGKTDFDYIAKEKAREFFEDEQRIIQTGQPLINKIEKQILPNGDTAWTSTTKVPLRDPDGKVVGLVGVNRDITALKEAETQLEKIHKELREVSRQAGMAEVATGVLHNVGNVLNSVNVAADLIAERLRNSKSVGVTKVSKLLLDHTNDLPHFLSEDERGRQVPAYLKQLAEHLDQERAEIREELHRLCLNIEHIKEIVATQQNYARVLGVAETVNLCEVMEDALRIQGAAYDRHGIKTVRDYDTLPTISVDKHKVMQIIVNLLSNAKYACDAVNRDDKKVIVRLKAAGEGRVTIEVADNGMGIPKANLTRIFSQGFTTRKEGHGFGLHSGALAAKELGGALNVSSDGPGLGASFVLELPTSPPAGQLKAK